MLPSIPLISSPGLALSPPHEGFSSSTWVNIPCRCLNSLADRPVALWLRLPWSGTRRRRHDGEHAHDLAVQAAPRDAISEVCLQATVRRPAATDEDTRIQNERDAAPTVLLLRQHGDLDGRLCRRGYHSGQYLSFGPFRTLLFHTLTRRSPLV